MNADEAREPRLIVIGWRSSRAVNCLASSVEIDAFPPEKPRTEARWVNEKALQDRRAASFQRQEKRLDQT